jgi:hypothetical protein
VEALARRAPGGEADLLLRAARTGLRLCDPETGSQQMGDAVSLTWDAVAVADRVVPDAGGSRLGDETIAGATGPITVRGGQVVWAREAAPQPLCVLTVDRSNAVGRSLANCDSAFPTSPQP